MTSYAPLLDKPEDKEGAKVYLTPVDALKLVKRVRRVSFFLRIEMWAYSIAPDAEGNGGRGWDLSENLGVTASQVEEVLKKKARFADMKREKDGTELVVEVRRLGDCLFFG